MKKAVEVENGAQGGSSPLGRNLPTGTDDKLPAKQGMAQWKTSKSGQASSLAARQDRQWGSHSRAKERISTSRGTWDGRYPQYWFNESPPTGKGNTFEQNRRVVCKSQETWFELCQVRRIVSEDQSACYQPGALWHCENSIHTAKHGRARIMTAGMQDAHREQLSYRSVSPQGPHSLLPRVKHNLKDWNSTGQGSRKSRFELYLCH